jgi:hypothetical protein
VKRHQPIEFCGPLAPAADSSARMDIEYQKLLGFSAVSEQLAGGVDFQDPTLGAKLGAKVGELDK